MDDSLEIPVSYKGQELSFPCRVIRAGYGYTFQVEVAGRLFNFEPDEEGNYRAAAGAAKGLEEVKVDTALLQAIAEVIESIVS